MRVYFLLKVYRYLKTVITMAIEIKFKCSRAENDFLKVNNLNGNVWIEGVINGQEIELCYDITTAIKLSKTIRTEINKAKEVNNG